MKLAFALFLFVQVHAQGVADPYCKFTVGAYKFDLTSLFRSDADGDYYGHDDQFIYHMNVCGPSHTGGACQTKNGTICQYGRKAPSDDGKNITGPFMAMIADITEIPTWALIDANDASKGVVGTYSKTGDTCTLQGKTVPRKAVISFFCVAKTFPNPSFLIHEDPGTCIYQISLNTPEACPRDDLPPPIVPGNVYPRTIGNGTWYYDSVVVTDTTAELFVKITQTGPNRSNFGDPDLYVRKNGKPTLDVYDRKELSSGDDEQLSFRKSDKEQPLSAGTYVIGVYAYGSKPVSYNIEAFVFDCPGNCSSHGVCNSGTCQCEEGYNVDILDDCSASIQDVELGTPVSGDFHQHDTTAFFRFRVADSSAYQLQASVDWNNTNVSARAVIARGRFPTLEDNDGSVWTSWYGSKDNMQITLEKEDVTNGTYIFGIYKFPRDAAKLTPYSFVANLWDCPAGCSGHGKCDKVSHNCTCDAGWMSTANGQNNCEMEAKDLTSLTSMVTQVDAHGEVYFSLSVPQAETTSVLGITDELIVTVECKHVSCNNSWPQVFLAYGYLPSATNHDFQSSRPLGPMAQIVVSPYELKAGRWYVFVPNYRSKAITISATMAFRPTKCAQVNPQPDTGHSSGTVAGFSILFLVIGVGIGFVVQSKRGGADRKHRMIDDGINADGSYDPPMIDNQY